MKSVWVVVGRTGEYSDAHEWAFGYYTTEAEAKVVAEALEYAFRVFLGGDKGPLALPERDRDWIGQYQAVGTGAREKAKKAMKSVDADFSLDYTGTCYEVREIRPGPSPSVIKTSSIMV